MAFEKVNSFRPASANGYGWALICALVLAILLALGWNILSARNAARSTMEELTSREAQQQRILQLNASMQSSALIAAATGDARGWIDDHRRSARELDQLFQELLDASASESMRSAAEIARHARGIKTAIESAALQAILEGRSESAGVSLRSNEYHEQGHQLGHAMGHIESAQLQDAIDGIRQADSRLQKSIFGATTLFALLGALGFGLLRASRRRERLRLRQLEERARSQRELADSLAMYQSLFEASNDIVLLVSSATGEIVDANHRACAMLELSRTEIGARSFDSLCDAPLEGLDPDFGTNANLCSGTVRLPVVVRGRSVKVAGQDFVQVAARDMSACRSLETQLEHAQRIESVGQLAGGVAHEFSNLALVLAGQADLMRNAMEKGQLSPGPLERIEAVAAEARRISRSLICFAGRSGPTRHPVDVRAVARSTIDLLVHTLPPNILLEPAGLTGPPLLVRSDESEVEQILLNLALNARDAMPSGGKLTIACSGMSEDFVQLVVEDTGTGIAPEHLDHIFEPMFTTKPAGAGTGLGLSIVKRLIQQLSGRVQVTSRPGAGSSFTVTLPRARVDDVPDPPARVCGDRTRRALAIRLAVTSPAAWSLLRSELERRGHRVVLEDPASPETGLADVAILVGPAGQGKPPRLTDRLRARVVVQVSTGTGALDDAEDGSVIRIGSAIPLEELVRIVERTANLETGRCT